MAKDIMIFTIYSSCRILMYATNLDKFFNRFRKCKLCLVAPRCVKIEYVRACSKSNPYRITLFNPCKQIRMEAERDVLLPYKQ